MPFTIVQLSDPHLGASWRREPARALTAALRQVRETLPGGPDAVILTGDLANTPAEAEYEQARRLLDQLSAPLYLLAGNHDDAEAMGHHFDLPDRPREHLSYVADLGPVRLVVVDTQDPGNVEGKLDRIRLQWLDGVLGADSVTPTLLAMHHPPIATGVPAMDAIGIAPEQRQALSEVVARHRQVQLIACGHVHRAVSGNLNGVSVLAVPSTGLQLALDLQTDELAFVDEPPCFAVHMLVQGRLVSHLQPVSGDEGGTEAGG
jgi:3',5'-cyclic AMP phosphodiesterase CpdA